MDTELFMECEEEELEPWQQLDDSVDEDDDDDDFMDVYGRPVEDSPSPPAVSSETPPPRTHPPITAAPAVTPRLPSVAVSSTPSSSAPPIVAQAPPLFLTQTAGGTFLLPAAPGSTSRQPILLTTQGFPVQTVMNQNGQLLLNFQPAPSVQPLTLFQSPSGLGQLVRPTVGVSPVLPQRHAVQSRPGTPGGSAFSAVQLPTTLTIRTTTPKAVNLQVSRVGGANTLKLAGPAALPSGSANGVAAFSGANTSVSSSVVSSSVATAPSVGPASTRVVMSVEEFYYGTHEGDLSLRNCEAVQSSTYSCNTCPHLATNNLRLMQHMLQHSQLVGECSSESKCCRFCYRQFSTSDQLTTHQDQVHGSAPSSSVCRICEWAFENEPAFLNHMKSNHKPGEMPYICQVCSYRSSFYANVLQHFANFHRDTRLLLCVFCLKVLRNPISYQQHLLRHQPNQAFHCNRCRLQFVFLKDKMQHKLENHRSFRRPPQLEGLPPGSKVTIRTYGKVRPTSGRPRGPASLIQPTNIKTEAVRSSPQQRNFVSKSTRPNKKPMNRRLSVRGSYSEEHLVCLECGKEVVDFSAHYPTHVHCLLCAYSSCCSRAYAAHMILHHVPPKRHKNFPVHKLPPPCVYHLSCSSCDFSPQFADQMAEHLLHNPLHYSATCRSNACLDLDLQVTHTDQQPTLQTQDQIQDQTQQDPAGELDPSEPSWRSAEAWTVLSEEDDGSPEVVLFKQQHGPSHSLSKASDAVDFFNLLFPAALIQLITTETNAHAKTCHFLGWSSHRWIPVTTHEVKGFLGLVILMGVQNLPNPAHYWSWSHYDNSHTFYRTMSFQRFKQIAANICMGSFATEQHRGTSNPADPLHIFRPMLDLLGRAVEDAYRPNCCLTIDRALLPSLEPQDANAKGSAKGQPQVWLLCDSKSGYCHRFHIQVEQESGPDPGSRVVLELVKGLDQRHHQLYLSSSLSSVPLMQQLLERGLYACTSFPPSNRTLPERLWADARLVRAGDFLQRRYGPLLATRWKDAKEMVCLSTNAGSGQTDTVWRRSQTRAGELDPIDRPLTFRLLQENMRGVDICKQLLACNPLAGVPQDRHWRTLFWFLVNLSVVNAFIVLRESRKENPPCWVLDGLFSQVNFRKRLGNQLAKCAQKFYDTTQIAGSRIKAKGGGAEKEEGEEPVKQRHRLAKICTLPKRCRVCNLKNVRKESVYGCSGCKVSLCKQASCFWELHNLPTHTAGSTKVGFLKDRISGLVQLDSEVDSSMAPVEEGDSTDEELVDEADRCEEPLNEEEPLDQEPEPPTAAERSVSRPLTFDTLTAHQLRVALFALCNGVRSASCLFCTEVRLIRCWLTEARKQLRGKEAEPAGEGVAQMGAWLLSMREQQLPISESSFFHKASALKKKGNFSDSFRISYDWAVTFLLRHRLGMRSLGRVPPLDAILPATLEPKVSSFRAFMQKLVRSQRLPLGAVAAMDELTVFVDFKLVLDKQRRSEALQVKGSCPLFTIYLAARADGTVLPTLVLVARPLDVPNLPEQVLLEGCAEGASLDDSLDVWTRKVWLQQLLRPGKSILVLDRHSQHLRDHFLSSISTWGTLPALIPAGGSAHLQPIEVCVKPVLQRLLLAKWTRFCLEDPHELDQTPPQDVQDTVTRRIMDFLLDALGAISTATHVWRRSFSLTRLLPATNQLQQEAPEFQQLDDQKELLMKMTQELLGSDSGTVLDMEDQEDTEEQEGEELQGEELQEKKATRAENSEEMEVEKGAGLEEKEEPKEKGEGAEEKGEVLTKTKRTENREEMEVEKDLELEESRMGLEMEGAELEERGAGLGEEGPRRATRIVIGKDVGDEWKIAVTDVAQDDKI